MNQEQETPKHRKRKPTGKKKYGVRYTYIGPRGDAVSSPLQDWMRGARTEWFVTKAAAEQSLQHWTDGTGSFNTTFRPRGSWTAEIVVR